VNPSSVCLLRPTKAHKRMFFFPSLFRPNCSLFFTGVPVLFLCWDSRTKTTPPPSIPSPCFHYVAPCPDLNVTKCWRHLYLVYHVFFPPLLTRLVRCFLPDSTSAVERRGNRARAPSVGRKSTTSPPSTLNSWLPHSDASKAGPSEKTSFLFDSLGRPLVPSPLSFTDRSHRLLRSLLRLKPRSGLCVLLNCIAWQVAFFTLCTPFEMAASVVLPAPPKPC